MRHGRRVIAGFVAAGGMIVLLGAAARADLIGYWAFDEGTGGAAGDSAGSNPGTIFGATWGSDAVRSTHLVFDGTDDYVNVGAIGFAGGNAPRTISGWARSNSPAGDDGDWTGIFGFIPNAGGNSLYFDVEVRGGGAPKPYCLHLYGQEENFGALTNDPNWHHFAATYDGTTVEMYLDGSPAVSFTPSNAPLNTQNWVEMGRRQAQNQYFNGAIDDVAIWDEALSAQDIAALYGGDSPLITPPVVLTWNGTDNEWGTPNWIKPSPPPVENWPNAILAAVVPSGTVTVEADHSARSLLVSGGEVAVDGGASLTVANDLNVEAGAMLSLADGAGLAANGRGVVASASTQGDSTFSGSGSLSVTSLSDGGVAGTLTKTGSGKVTLNSGSIGSTTLRPEEGVLKAHASMAPAEVVLAGGTLEVGEAGAGLLAGEISGRFSFAPNPGNLGVQDRPWHGLTNVKSANPLEWRDDSTFVYTGQFYDADGVFAFAESIDDDVVIVIDGVEVLRNQQWDVPTSTANTANNSAPGAGTLDFGPGWHDIEIRFSHGGGGAGAVAGSGWTTTKGFGLNADPGAGFSSTNGGDYGDSVIDPGDGSLFRYVTGGPIDWTATPITVQATAGPSLLDALSTSSAAFGHLTLQDGATLMTSSADMTLESLSIAGAAGRSATLAPQNHVTVDTYDDGGTATTLAKGGSGTLLLDNTGGGIVAGATAFQVQAGTLHGLGADPLGGSSHAVLDGGLLLLEAGSTTTANILHASQIQGATSNSLLNMQGAYVPAESGTFTGQNGLLAMDPARRAALTIPLSFQNQDAGGGFADLFPGMGREDNFGTLFTGQFTPNESGPWQFRLDVDDQGSLYIDLNGDFAFDASEQIKGPGGTQTVTTPALVAGKSYNIAIGHREGGGTERIRAEYQAPSGGGLEYINPADAAQSGLWSGVSYDTFDLSGLDVTATGTAEIRIVSGVPVSLRDLTLDSGSVLTTSGADMAFRSTTISDTTATLNTASNVTMGTYDDGGATKMLVKRGNRTLVADNTTPGTIAATGTTFEVEEGTFHAIGTDPLGAGGAALLHLDGGTFIAESAPALIQDRIQSARYNGANNPDNLTGIDDGSPNGENGGLFALAPSSSGGWYTETNDPGSGDNYAFMWSGTFTAPETGDYTFRTHGDDHEVFWLDLNRNGEFEEAAGEQITLSIPPEDWNTPKTGTASLTAGLSYDFAAAYYEGGGGEFFEFQLQSPSMGALAFANPSDAAQAGWWSSLGRPALDMTNTPIRVTASSNLQAVTDFSAAFGELTIENDAVLSTSGAPMSFVSTSIAGAAGRSGTINHPNEVDIGAYDDGGVATTFIKQGGGTMLVDTAKGIAAAATDFRVEGGLLQPSVADPLGPAGATVTLAGGNLVLEGAPGTDYVAGLAFGRVPGNLGFGPNPGGQVQMGPHVAASNDGGEWPDNQTNVYTGEIYYDGGPGYHFIESIDDKVWLNIDGTVYIHDEAWSNTTGSGPIAFPDGEGWYRFELRMSDGGGGQGPVNFNPGFQYNNAGTVSLDPADHVYPEDPGDMSLFRHEVAVKLGIDEPDIHIGVDGSGGTLDLQTDYTAALGSLTFKSGTLNISGAPEGVSFTSGQVDAGASTFALNTPSPVTVAGPYGGNGATATFNKTGEGDMTLAQGTTDHGGVSVNVKAGRLVSQDAMQASELIITGTATVDTGASNVTITDGGIYAYRNWGATVQGTGADFEVGGADLAVAPDRIAIHGGTVTVSDTPTVPTAGLVGHWTFDDGTADDSSGNGYHGAVTGGVFSADVPAVFGSGQSIDLTAADSYVVVDTDVPAGADPNQDAFDLDQMTVSVWVKGWPAGGDWQPFVAKGGESGQGWQLRRNGNSGSEIAFTLRGPGNDDFHTGGTSAADGEWHNIVGTYGDGNRRIYVDGVLLAEENRSGNVNNTISKLMFGARDADGWNGGTGFAPEDFAQVMLDNIRIYDHAVNQGEVVALASNVTVRPAIDLPDTDVTVTASAVLDAVTDSTATFGSLTVPGGATLTLAGAPGGFSFDSAAGGGTIDGSATLRTMAAPGDSAGALAFTGDVALEDGFAYEWELAPEGHDVIQVGGTLDLEGGWTLELVDAGGESHASDRLYLFTGLPQGTDPLEIVDDAWTPYSIDLSRAPAWLEFTDPADLRILRDDVGLYLTGLQSVPEPSSLGLAGLGLLLLAGAGLRVRRRRGASR